MISLLFIFLFHFFFFLIFLLVSAVTYVNSFVFISSFDSSLSPQNIFFIINFFCLLRPLRIVCSYHVFLFSYTTSFICSTFATVRITFFLALPDSLSPATCFKRIRFHCLQNSYSTQVMFPSWHVWRQCARLLIEWAWYVKTPGLHITYLVLQEV